ncbi:MAG: helix-hairpin-helix domain-containing protein [Myxococcales bacterium]|nr:helix-hairpin-helix domain-containing protein [Myxococcales bacterium]MCB9670413.1 helix-hairpin-helix domain-containing protein [Alphaproteobacteria bacterium]
MITFLLWLAGAAFAAEPPPAGLNRATVDQLARLDGVGPELARDVVALRTARGHLGSVEELRILPGMTEAALDTLRREVPVEVELPMGTSARFDTPGAVLAHFSTEPTVQQAQAWASAYAEADPESVRRWMRSAKRFAALPTLWVRYRLTNDFDQDYQYFATDGVIDQDGEQLFNVLDDAGAAQEAQYMVQARWDLDKLVMSSERIRVLSETQDLVKLRDKTLTEVNRLYFERRRVQVEMLLAPKLDTLGQVKDELRVMELTANLDALTGGRFSAALTPR